MEDPSGLLDRNLRDFDTAYRTFVDDTVALDQLTKDWYAEANGGQPAAATDVSHGRWRASVERDRWGTVRGAYQEAWPLPVAPLPPGTIEVLRPERHYLIGVSGTRFTARCASDFRLFERFLNREDIGAILDQRVACGSNMVRVLGTCHNMFRLYPQEHPDYFDRLPAFRAFLEAHGLYLQFTAFADATVVMPDQGQQLAFWQQIGAALRESSALVELVNENDQPVNKIDAGAFPRLSGVLCSHGSNGSQAWPIEPHWDFATFHTNASSEEQRKVGHGAMEIWGGPTITNETSRYPEVGMWAGQPLERQKMLAFDSGAGAALLCAGYCFHSVNGKQSVLWDGNEQEIAREMARGALSVPLDYQDGNYYHRDDLEPSGVLRTYERRLGNGTGHIVLIHA